MTNSAAAGELTGDEIWTLRRRLSCLEHPCPSSQTSLQVTASIQVSSLTWQQNVTTDSSGTSKRDWSKCSKNTKQNSWLEARHAHPFAHEKERKSKLRKRKTMRESTPIRASKRTRDS